MRRPYYPRPATKAGQAMELLQRGAISRVAFGPLLGVQKRHVDANLRVLLQHNLVSKCEMDGVIYYHLVDRPAEDVAELDDAPFQRVVDKASVRPSEEALRFANPFGLRAAAATQRVSP